MTGGVRSFYELGFASQLIVWALRRHLHLVRSGRGDADVARAFYLGGLRDLHLHLQSVVEVLLCGSRAGIQLHAVGCPCLAPHEIVLLNAMTHLQGGCDDEARAGLVGLLCGPAAGLVLPTIRAIVRELDAHGLCVESPRLARGEVAGAVTVH
jgi:hypothetical protein